MIDQGYPIELSGNGSLVPHTAILEAASQADFGLVAHQPNPSNENCIPTKIYEYLGIQLPMLLQNHPLLGICNPTISSCSGLGLS